MEGTHGGDPWTHGGTHGPRGPQGDPWTQGPKGGPMGPGTQGGAYGPMVPSTELGPLGVLGFWVSFLHPYNILTPGNSLFRISPIHVLFHKGGQGSHCRES